MKEEVPLVGGCAVLEDISAGSELDEDRMGSSFDEFLALAEWTIKGLKEGELSIQDSLESLAGYMGSRPESSSSSGSGSGSSLEEGVEDPEAKDKEFILAGFTNCMHEAIRYLVEEEQLSSEDPIVTGLRQHLVSQQEHLEFDRLLQRAAEADQEPKQNEEQDAAMTVSERLRQFSCVICVHPGQRTEGGGHPGLFLDDDRPPSI